MESTSENRINFAFAPFDEDIVVIGGKGRGKTNKVKEILLLLSALNYIIFDFNWQYTGFGRVVHEVKDITTREQIVFQPKDKTIATYVAFCKRIFELAQVEPNVIIIHEEVHQYVTKQKTIPELYSIVMTGRNYGISNIFVSTTTTALPNWILTNANHCFAFSTSNESAIKWLEGYLGSKAWLLVPQDKRLKNNIPQAIKEFPNLTRHSCIYRNQTNDDADVMICDCNTCRSESQ